MGDQKEFLFYIKGRSGSINVKGTSVVTRGDTVSVQDSDKAPVAEFFRAELQGWRESGA